VQVCGQLEFFPRDQDRLLVELGGIETVFTALLLIAGGAASFKDGAEAFRRKTIQGKTRVLEGGCGDCGDFLPGGDAGWIVNAKMLAPLSIRRIVLKLEAENLESQGIEELVVLVGIVRIR